MSNSKFHINKIADSKEGKQFFISKSESNEKHYQSDKEIWNAFKGGSRIAYRLIYERYADALYNYGNKITPYSELVEDCLQELFVELWMKKSKLGAVENIKAYLFTSYRRRLIDLIKKSKKEVWISSIDNLEILFNYTSESIVISDNQRASILKELNALSAQKKEAIFLRFYNDLSCIEVAEIMEIKAQSVYNLISSGLKILKDAFKNTYL